MQKDMMLSTSSSVQQFDSSNTEHKPCRYQGSRFW